MSGGFTLGAFIALTGCSAVDKLHGWHRENGGCERCHVQTAPPQIGEGMEAQDMRDDDGSGEGGDIGGEEGIELHAINQGPNV